MQVKGLQLKSAIICLLLILIVLSSIVACAKTTPTTTAATTSPKTSPTATTPSPQYGGTLKIITGTGLINIGYPGESGSSPGDTVLACPAVENLVRMDTKGLPEPWLATAWQYSADYTSLTFTLRKGVKFHDGTDFNATAAKYCLDLVRESTRPDLKSVSSIDIVDDYTIRLNLSKYEPQMLTTMAFGRPGWIVSPTAIKANSKEWCMLHPVGTGPFKFVSYQTDVSLKFEKFDGYWQKGKPYLDAVQYLMMADQTTGLMAFQAGDGQIIRNAQNKDAADLQASKKYVIGQTPMQVAMLIPDGGHANSPFANIKVRQAVAYAIDRQKISDTLGYGYTKPANQPFGSWSWAYNPAVVGYPYDLTKAKQLLTEAGYPSGLKTKITYTSGGNNDIYVAEQGSLSGAGINVELVPASSVLMTQLSNSGWDGLIVGSVAGSVGSDPGSTLGSRLSKKGTQYLFAFYPDDYEAALASANKEPDTEKRKALIQAAVKLIIDQYCMAIPITEAYGPCPMYPQVHDTGMGQYWSNQWYPADAWLSK